MKKSLLQKAKDRLTALTRPQHKSLTRIKKGLVNPYAPVGGIQPVQTGGRSIEYSRASRGKGKRLTGINRSKHTPHVGAKQLAKMEAA